MDPWSSRQIVLDNLLGHLGAPCLTLESTLCRHIFVGDHKLNKHSVGQSITRLDLGCGHHERYEVRVLAAAVSRLQFGQVSLIFLVPADIYPLKEFTM